MVIVVSLAASSVAAAPAVIRMDPASVNASYAQGNFSVDIVIEGAVEVAAFDLTVEYDAAIIDLVHVHEGEFLSSTGRAGSCPRPVLDAGIVMFGCYSMGRTPVAASGSGVLASLTFRPIASGTTPLHFAKAELSDVWAYDIPATSEDGVVTVTGGPAPKPQKTPAQEGTPGAGTPAPTVVGGLPTPVTTAEPVATQFPFTLLPAPDATPGVADWATGVTGPDVGGAGSGQSAGAFGRLGTGTVDEESDWGAGVVSMVLAASGAVLLIGGAAAQLARGDTRRR